MIIYNRDKKKLIIPSGLEAESYAKEIGYSEGYTDGHAAGVRETENRITPTLDVDTNGEYIADLGFKKVNVNVEQHLLDEIFIKENGIFFPDEGHYGWNYIYVDVPSVSTEEITRAEYEALEEKDPFIIYCIKD